MLKRELSKGAIAKFMHGHIGSSNPTLVQVIDLKEDKSIDPSTTIFVYLGIYFRLSDGINSCRAIIKLEDKEELKKIRIFDVIVLESNDLAYVNGLYDIQ
jgi:hypothetical protein